MKIKPTEIPNFWIFNFEGLELYDKDIFFLKNKETLYFSRGENFKIETYYSEYKILEILG